MLQVDLDPNAGIFITMNPAGKGYGGRQKLPDNLKQLFRPVAMSRPDNEQIAEVILFSEGFKKAKDLGRKLVALFTLSMLAVDIAIYSLLAGYFCYFVKFCYIVL